MNLRNFDSTTSNSLLMNKFPLIKRMKTFVFILLIPYVDNP